MLTILGMWMDDPGALSSGNSRLLMFFVGLVAIAMLVQAIVVITFAVGALKSQRRLVAIAEEIRNRTLPVMDSAEDLFHDAAPKLRILTDNLVETSHIVRAKAQEFDATLSLANQKTRAQINRVDEMVSTTISRTAAIGDILHEGVRVPMKQVAGVIAGLKAGLDTLLHRAKSMGYRPPEI